MTDRSIRLVEARVLDVGVWYRPPHRRDGPAMLQGVVLETNDDRLLGIAVGPIEAAWLALAFTGSGTPTGRPLTHPFYLSLLVAAGARIERVVIDALVQSVDTPMTSTYHAKVMLQSSEEPIDARPSDALTLAVLSGAPIYVADNVLIAAAVAREEWNPSWLTEHAPDVAQKARQRFWPPPGTAPDYGQEHEHRAAVQGRSGALTSREREVLELVAAGHTNIEAGAVLGLSPYTITRHLANAYGKLGVNRRAQAVAVLVG